MASVYDGDNFAGRVDYAVAFISNWRGDGTRSFDTCFEMNDGDAVCVAVYRRSLKNPKLAANIWRALSQSSVMQEVERYKDVPTRELPALARRMRSESAKGFVRSMAKMQLDYIAESRSTGECAYCRGEYSEAHRDCFDWSYIEAAAAGAESADDWGWQAARAARST